MEVWKSIKGYEGIYEVSNLGNVKSLERYVKHPITYRQKVNERILKKGKNKGYYRVVLCKDNCKKNLKVCRLVALTFIPNIENKPQVNHINGIKSDDRVENLEWNTSRENINHSFKLGLSSNLGEKNSISKLKEIDVLNIRNLLKTEKRKVIAEKYNLSYFTIRDIQERKIWKHI